MDRDKLAQQLRDAASWWITYSAAAYFASSKHPRKAVKRPELFRRLVNKKRAIKGPAKIVKRFRTVLLEEVVEEIGEINSPNSDPVDTKVIALRWRSVFTGADLKAFLVSLDRVIVSLDRIIDVAEGAAETYDHKTYFEAGKVAKFRSPKEQFVGEQLASIYKDCFDVKKIGKSGGGDTPFTRFAIAVMEEMKEEITADVVRHALERSRSKRVRDQEAKLQAKEHAAE